MFSNAETLVYFGNAESRVQIFIDFVHGRHDRRQHASVTITQSTVFLLNIILIFIILSKISLPIT